MRILILSPYYFPYINPRAHRWTSIAEHWAKQGHDVHVITSRNKNYNHEYTSNGVKIYRSGFNALKEILYFYSKNISKRGEAAQKKKNAGKKGVVLQWINDNILRKIYFPDDTFTWYFPARRKGIELLNEHKFDLLISSSLPFTTHIIALHLKKKNKQLNWIADTGDPFAFQPLYPINNYQIFGRLNKKLEKKVAILASSISLTNQGAVNLYKKEFPEFKEKFILIPPVLSKNENKKITSIHKEQKLIFGYFGSFFRKVREPKILLDFIAKAISKYSHLENSEWHFYGNIFENFIKDFESYPELKTNLYLYGMVSREEVEIKMQEINFLVNVGNAVDFQLASKCTDYLASGKPIINIKTTAQDTFADFFKDYPLILNIDHGTLPDTLGEFIEENKRKVIQKENIIKYCTPYTVPMIAKQYLDVIKPVQLREEENF